MSELLNKWFDDPVFLLLLSVLPVLLWYGFRRRKIPAIRFSSIRSLAKIQPPLSLRMRHTVVLLRIVVFLLLIFALARPHAGREDTVIREEGIDIVLAIDVSGSMRAEDFHLNGERVNRLEIVKDVVRDFIKSRKGDRIGLVVYASRAYTQCPMTLDYGVLLKFLDRLEIGMIDENQTAIGSALAASVMRLKESKAKSRVVILLTDGRNNAGSVPPMTAASMAKALDIKVYTVGAGTRGKAPFPQQTILGTRYKNVKIEIDDDLLSEIAQSTDAEYFRATDTQALRQTYEDIDKMEKTEAEIIRYLEYVEIFPTLVIAALVIFLLEQILANTLFRTLP